MKCNRNKKANKGEVQNTKLKAKGIKKDPYHFLAGRHLVLERSVVLLVSLERDL